jgi:hypothetical protein
MDSKRQPIKKRDTPKNARGSKSLPTKMRYFNNSTFIKPKYKQDCQVNERIIFANQKVEGEGDAFQFDDYRAKIFVAHRQFTEGLTSLKDNRPTVQASQRAISRPSCTKGNCTMISLECVFATKATTQNFNLR